MCGLWALGDAYPEERSALPAVVSPKLGKRKAVDALFSNAPVKRRLFPQPTPRKLREQNKAAEHQNAVSTDANMNLSIRAPTNAMAGWQERVAGKGSGQPFNTPQEVRSSWS